MTVRVFLILPPVRMGFINHDISVFISEKIPILDFFLSPRMIRVKRTHSQKQMDMGVAIPFIVDGSKGKQMNMKPTLRIRENYRFVMRWEIFWNSYRLPLPKKKMLFQKIYYC